MSVSVQESDISSLLRGTQQLSSEQFGADITEVTIVPWIFDLTQQRIHFSIQRSYVRSSEDNLPQHDAFALSLPVKPADPQIGIRSEEIVIGPESLQRVQPQTVQALRRTLYALADEIKQPLSQRQIVIKTGDGVVQFMKADEATKSAFQEMLTLAQITYGKGPLGNVFEELRNVITTPEKES